MRHFFLLLALSAAATAHDEYMGSCPRFEPMTNFDWDEVKEETLQKTLTSAYYLCISKLRMVSNFQI